MKILEGWKRKKEESSSDKSAIVRAEAAKNICNQISKKDRVLNSSKLISDCFGLN